MVGGYQSCLDVVVTPLMEHETTRTRMTTVRTLAAATEFVAFKTTPIYGWPVEDPSAASISPRQNIKVTKVENQLAHKEMIVNHLNERTNHNERSYVIRDRSSHH